MKPLSLLIAVVVGWTAVQTEAQIYDTNDPVVQTFVGSAFSGYLDGLGQQTMFHDPQAMAVDSSGNLFVYDYYNARIRKITPEGTVSTFAGGGGSIPGQGTNAFLPASESLTIDHSNNLYFISYPDGLSMIRIGPDASVSNIPLNGLVGGQVRDGLCVDSGNNVYIADNNGNRIYRYRSDGKLEVFAGSRNGGAVDGNGVFTSFSGPSALAVDSADNIYVWDSGNHLIRRINQTRDVVTIAGKFGGSNADGDGTIAGFESINSMAVDDIGNLILACGIAVRKLSVTTNATTIAGSFTKSGYTNGPGNMALFNGADSVCYFRGTIYVTDSANNRIRTISSNPSNEPVSPSNLTLKTYAGLQLVGTVGRTYQIQSSADMTNWNTVATLLLTSSPYLWFDLNSATGTKFYRSFLLP